MRVDGHLDGRPRPSFHPANHQPTPGAFPPHSVSHQAAPGAFPPPSALEIMKAKAQAVARQQQKQLVEARKGLGDAAVMSPQRRGEGVANSHLPPPPSTYPIHHHPHPSHPHNPGPHSFGANIHNQNAPSSGQTVHPTSLAQTMHPNNVVAQPHGAERSPQTQTSQPVHSQMQGNVSHGHSPHNQHQGPPHQGPPHPGAPPNPRLPLSGINSMGGPYARTSTINSSASQPMSNPVLMAPGRSEAGVAEGVRRPEMVGGRMMDPSSVMTKQALTMRMQHHHQQRHPHPQTGGHPFSIHSARFTSPPMAAGHPPPPFTDSHRMFLDPALHPQRGRQDGFLHHPRPRPQGPHAPPTAWPDPSNPQVFPRGVATSEMGGATSMYSPHGGEDKRRVGGSVEYHGRGHPPVSIQQMREREAMAKQQVTTFFFFL